MITRLAGGRVYDPANGLAGETRDIFFADGRIVPPADPDVTIDAGDGIVMAGAIDMHTHIGGGKVNIARLMMQGEPGEGVVPTAPETGLRYAEIGYTACFEPAVLPVNARQAHFEMADTPIIDTGGYVVMSSNDLVMEMLAGGESREALRDYLAWTLDATQCIGIKAVNPGGVSAFKFNQRRLDVDEPNAHYGVTPRRIIAELSAAIDELGLPHPLHVHTSNLGVAGNHRATLDTIDAAEGRRLHLTHLQFHSYGDEGDLGFSSAAARIAEKVNACPNITIDVGQIMFGQTVTVSGDTMMQHRNCRLAAPRKWAVIDIECEEGCGVVPFRYRDKNFVNALQWAIGLELFLLIDDPWRVFLTTDHPNGAPFSCYPHLIRLLMDRSFRNDMLAHIHPEAARMSHLGSLQREYTLDEIAIMTRAAPARLLGLGGKGHLGAGADADIVVYAPDDNPERMFARPRHVFKDGREAVRDGRVLPEAARVARFGGARTHVAKPDYDAAVTKRVKRHFEERRAMRFENFAIGETEMAELIGSQIEVHPCRSR